MFFAFALGDFLAGFSHITFMIPVKRNKLKKKTTHHAKYFTFLSSDLHVCIKYCLVFSFQAVVQLVPSLSSC